MRSTRDGLICPHRIIEDVGSGFCIGTMLGTIWHFSKGCFTSPRAMRFKGGITLVKKRVPGMGGSFAVWMGLFGFFQCAFLHVTARDSHINQVLAGFCTGAVVNMRGGHRYMMRGAVSGGIFIGLFNIVEIVMAKTMAKRDVKAKQMMYKADALRALTDLKQFRPDLITCSDRDLQLLITEIRNELNSYSDDPTIAALGFN